MSTSIKPGAIHSLEAYAQGKMLDHSGWYGILPRGITPSDIDTVFDNKGDILFCELSRHHPIWSDLSRGQLMLYFNAIGPVSKHFAVLLKHSVDGRQIDTMKDVDSFHVMIRKGQDILFWPDREQTASGDRWRKFAPSWFKDVCAARKYVIESAVEADFNIDDVKWLAEYEHTYLEAHGEMPW